MPGMRALRPAGHPVSRTAARWVFDVLVTLLAAASALPDLVHNGDQARTVELAVLALEVAPLLVRRVWPLPVFGWAVAAAGAAGLWDRHLADGLAVLIALYTVASLRTRRDTLACAAVLELVVVAGLFRYAGSNWWYDGIFLSGMIAAALGLGLYSAARRAYLAELHDRAERLERERDQQGALAAAAERARIAREMHDIVAHHLTVMTALAEGAAAASGSSPERAAEAMRTVAITGRRALADTRRLLGVLRQKPGQDPEWDSGEALQPVPGIAQLDALIGQVRSAGLETRVEITGQAPDMPAGAQLAVYRLVQESLTNTLKHGGAGARARVRLRFLPGELRVDVDDDGAGALAPLSASAGSGLPGMKERIRAYGGDVAVGPRQPAGWAVSARLPLDELDEGGTE
jgi:signal transduction histidine kinase